MKTHLIVAICFLTLFSDGLAQDGDTKFQDIQGRFRINFPTDPEITKQSNDTEYGRITKYSFIAKPEDDDNLSYEVYYLDYPESFTDTLSIESIYALFNGAQTTNFNSENILEVGAFNLEILGYPGREFRWQYSERNLFSRLRFYLVHNRMYVLAVNTEAENNFNISVNQFFESFELINTAPNPTVPLQLEEKRKIYTITFPGTTEIRELEAPTEYGKAKVIFEAFQPKLENDANLIYGISILEYSEDISETEGFDLNTYYEDIIQSALVNRQSTLISKKTIYQNGVEGIEVKESFRGGQIIIYQRTFLKENKQITIQVMTIPLNDKNESMMDFFNSFEFAEN